jgi:hypothetical protein
MIIRTAIICACLAACSTPKPPEPPSVPIALRSCPEGVRPPQAPRAPRTWLQILTWSGQIEAARYATQRALTECADRLAQLNDWIDANRR